MHQKQPPPKVAVLNDAGEGFGDGSAFMGWKKKGTAARENRIARRNVRIEAISTELYEFSMKKECHARK